MVQEGCWEDLGVLQPTLGAEDFEEDLVEAGHEEEIILPRGEEGPPHACEGEKELEHLIMGKLSGRFSRRTRTPFRTICPQELDRGRRGVG